MSLINSKVINLDELKLEHFAKGADSFEKFVTAKFEEGNAFCAALGGKRYDLKNLIKDAAHGKYVK